MLKLENENILKEIFSSIKYTQLKHLLLITQNQIVSRQTLKLISYENLFKTIGKSRITLKLENCITSIALLINGNIATITGNQVLNIWSIETYKCIHTSIINKFSLMISLPNGILAIAKPDYNQVKLLDSNNDFKIIETISLDYEVINMFLLSNGSLLVSTYTPYSSFNVGYGGCFEIIDSSNNYHKVIYKGEYISSLANLTNYKIVASYYKRLILIDGLDDYKSKLIKELDKDIYALTYQNGCLISASTDYLRHIIDIWVDIESNIKCIKSIKINSPINCLLSLPGGFFASGAYDVDCGIMIWDLSTYKCINNINFVQRSDNRYLLLLKDNRIISYSYDEYTLFLCGH
jgi:WD40 repeat protein